MFTNGFLLKSSMKVQQMLEMKAIENVIKQNAT